MIHRVAFIIILVVGLTAGTMVLPGVVSGADTGSGHFRLGEVKAEFSHVYAFRTEDDREAGKYETYVFLTSVPLDVKALANSFDISSDVRKQLSEKKGGMARLVVGAEGNERGIYFSNTEPSESFNTGGSGEFKIAVLTDKRIEGSFILKEPSSFFEKTYDFELIFSADVSHSLIQGEPLPKGGGEPGKAYLDYAAAVAKGDVDTIKKMLGEKAGYYFYKGMTEEGVKSSLESLKYDVLVDAKITGGLLREDQAILRVEGKDDDGDKQRGRILMVKTKSGWVKESKDLHTIFD